jgi:hypothetical protein
MVYYNGAYNTKKSVILLKHTKKNPNDNYVMVSFLETQKEKNKHDYEPVSIMEFFLKKRMIFGSKTPIFPVFA